MPWVGLPACCAPNPELWALMNISALPERCLLCYPNAGSRPISIEREVGELLGLASALGCGAEVVDLELVLADGGWEQVGRMVGRGRGGGSGAGAGWGRAGSRWGRWWGPQGVGWGLGAG